MSRKFQRWIRSRAGMATLVTVLAIVIIAAVWYGLTATPGTVIRPPDAWEPPPGGYSCLPTCDETDGMMFSHVGASMDSFAAQPIITWVSAPAGMDQFEVGIFDGDSGRTDDGAINWRQGNWDNTTTETTYTLYADPLRNGVGEFVVGQWMGNTPNPTAGDGWTADAELMPNNDWYNITIQQFEEARGPSGHYFYRLEATRPVGDRGINAFKLRSTGYLSTGQSNLVDASFSIVGMYATISDAYILYPELSDAGLGPSTYTGEWQIPFFLPAGTEVLEIWDGDFDHGSWDGSTLDIDDPVSGTGYIPEWADPNQVVPQDAQGIGVPADDSRSTLFRRSPAVYYQLIDPFGEPVYVKENPSGSEEWEKFVVSTDPDILAHHYTDRLGPGTYIMHIVGLDKHNTVWIRMNYEVFSECADGSVCVPPPVYFENEVCPAPRTIGYWGSNAQKLVQGRTRGVQESVETFELALYYISLESEIYHNNGVPLTLEEASDMLNLRGQQPMEARARQQNLALWLNVASGKLSPTTVVVLNDGQANFEGTVYEAMRYAEEIILTGGNMEEAKDIADLINNGEIGGGSGESSSCEDYENVMPPDKQPPDRGDAPKAPQPPAPPNPTPDPEPDPETCELRVNQYGVENTTNNPFYGIKFEYQSGEEVRDGRFDEFKFTVTLEEAEAMNENGIMVQAKAATMEGQVLMDKCDFTSPFVCGETVKDDDRYFAFFFFGAEDNGDGTLTLTFQVQNMTDRGLSHATFGLPAGVTPSSPSDSYQSEVCISD